MRASTRKGYRKIIESDLEIMPLMNLFVALIPMLLISAVFLNVTVIDMQAPPPTSDDQDSDVKKGLALAVTIEDERYQVTGSRIKGQTIRRTEADAEDKLAAVLAAVAANHPDNQDVTIVSQPYTKYYDIIAVMDISRDAGLPAISLLGADN
jgi:biopolymer transport protein ExbD